MPSLTPEGRERLNRLLVQEEGLMLFVYTDSLGNDTVGVGRLLSRGIRKDEAMLMLKNDIEEAIAGIRANLSFFDQIDEVRKIVLISMAFQIGVRGLLGFKRMLSALKALNYRQASKEILNSSLALQTPARASRLAKAMATGLL